LSLQSLCSHRNGNGWLQQIRFLWDSEVAELTEEEKKIVAAEIHSHPELASKISYERTHTGFARVITVTVDDIARLYDQNVAAE